MGTENECAAVPPGGAHGSRYYRFTDASGRMHVVDSLDSVPGSLRAHAACIEYQDSPVSAPGTLARAASAPTGYQMFAVGFASALLLAFVFSRLPGTLRWFVRAAILGAVAALLVGAYFGWLRRASQQSDATFAGPGALIEDAKRAVAQMNARVQAEQAELKEAEQAK